MFRKYEKRYSLYKFVNEHFKLAQKEILYLEFGVANGYSFKWWLENNTHVESRFFGFDTFDGLPEKWGGFYNKGDMRSPIPAITDQRSFFYKGLFQDILHPFLKEKTRILDKAETKIIHLDADLYSATAFVLTQLYPYLKPGDIIMFDEFNVPLHEFKAYQEFISISYLKLTPVAAVNNFYQVSFIVGEK